MRRSSLHCTLLVALALAWVPNIARAGGARPGARETPAQQKANKARNVVQGEQGRVIQSSATSIVRKSGARITAKEVVKLSRKTGRHRVSRGSSYKTGDAEAWGVGKSEVR
jgi:hypothetical protein